MSWLLIVLSAVVLVIWIITVADIIRRDLHTKQMVAWLLIVVILPFIGAIAYWAMRPSSEREIEQANDAQADLRRTPPGTTPHGTQGL